MLRVWVCQHETNRNLKGEETMDIEKIEKNGTICAVVRSDEIVITDAQSALDLLMTAKYELGTKNIVIDKKRIKETFFKK